MEDDLGPVTIERAVKGAFGAPLRFHETTGSTNTDALAWAGKGAPHGAVVVADQQTSGRGRWGREWRSEPGRSLLFSVVLRLPADHTNVSLLTTALGVACVDAFESLSGLGVQLKWPNDVLVSGRKIAGILVESQRGDSSATVTAVAGVGVNVDWPPGALPSDISGTATSLTNELPREAVPSRAELLATILLAIETRYEQWLNPSSWDGILERAHAASAIVGQNVTIRFAGGDRLTGRALAIRSDGRLELEAEGRTVAVDAGEIEQIRPD